MGAHCCTGDSTSGVTEHCRADQGHGSAGLDEVDPPGSDSGLGLVTTLPPSYSDWNDRRGKDPDSAEAEVQDSDTFPVDDSLPIGGDDEIHVLVQKRLVGLEVDPSDGATLVIDKIAGDGLIEDWNRVNPHVKVKEGDRIVSVNGIRGDTEEMVERIRRDSKLLLVMTRDGQQADEFAVSVHQRTEKVGIDVDLSNGETLVVESINGGLVSEWNQKNPDDQIREGDIITSVNGASGDAQELVNICKGENVLLLLVKRNPEGDGTQVGVEAQNAPPAKVQELTW